MFYSQFILAKKGPLGTIWIAAHLERKLRKNQVADTDIGVSVDSIIFPEVPIALRLSSHLLLGVVRIYSRKVNYLFDDCSEALLKIKQAFRSTAVDLPPEESTAPYHSITLPETFDLDDFELPDNEIFQGNYVDHHVSAKEQITLQDTMDGVVYSTSQFGLDERFGDGDTCQIGLDLNEQEALLGKAATPAATPMNDGAFDDDPQSSLPPMTPFEADDNNDGSMADGSKIISENYGGNQAEILDTKPESSEYAEAPATPMLVEEANLSSVQEALVSDDHLESEAHNVHGEMEVKEAETKGYSEPASECVKRASENGALHSPNHPEPEKPMLSASQCPNGVMVLESADGIQNGIEGNEGTNICIDRQTETQNTEKLEARPDENAASPMSLEVEKRSPIMGDGAAEMADSPKKSSEDAVGQLGSLHSLGVADGVEFCEELKDHETSSVLPKDKQSKFIHGLQPCNSNVSHQNKSVLEGDQQCSADDVTGVAVNENHVIEPASNGKVQTNAGELLDQFYSEALKDISGNDNSTVNLDPPAPETLLSASDFVADKPNDLLVESTPNKEGLEEGLKQISGRKRSLTESAVTMQSNSLETFGLSQSKRTGESIPDDDDLLSSILVGRRSSVLKMKPTPAPLEVISSKRPRMSQRASASKRKVLIDETMVLLGDMIRQQLMSTEDLRRVRKKAPCTLSEISVIQRQFLEDEIFGEPTLAGLSRELFYMHKETYDVSGTKVCEVDGVIAPAEVTKESSVRSDVTLESEKGSHGTLPVRDDGEVQAAETLPRDQNHQDEEFATDSLITDSEVLIARHESFDMASKMDMDEGKAEGADAPSFSVVSELDMAAPDAVPEDRCNVPDNLATEANLVEQEGVAGEPHLSPHHTLNEHPSVKDSSEANVLIEGADAVAEHFAHVAEAELHTGIAGIVDAVTDFPMEHGIIPSDLVYVSSGTALAAPEEQDNLILMENTEDAERFGNSNVDAVGGADIGSSSIPKDDFRHSVEHEGYTDNTSLVGDEEARFHEDLGGRDIDADGRDDLENTGIGNDTEFLNVDDDEVDEDNEHLSDAEDSRLLDNSGWSSRTRAVAKYLQTLFDKKAVRGKSTLPMDSLLAGKTRKEASRMFFESLVLKTRDYIQVEQVKPFDNINLKPGLKLMKSQF
ncbi:sister chromatid cohesion 1 protein 4 isoform X1 [Punica granatum]|uniref:Sister chromatid cohesion 1 protein 4 isoform X1 n=2 Tax=Punica granatum TaxID=22663 RepID=A0A6P8CCH7_PUNGR|nr:sister chromatid cohesion 1 protein 4 isoform X1 [Punica granatum]XP_031381586.1 sister chromatid cohesion 1 protein 4 isoform X1 [Punica granatum]